MGDLCTITRPGTETVTSTEPPFTVTTLDDLDVYAGPCIVNEQTSTAPTVQAQGQDVYLQTHTARVPSEAVGIEPGDILTVTESHDPRLVDQTFDIVDVRSSSFVVSRRLGLRSKHRAPSSE